MDIQNLLNIADELVFSGTGKHLNNLQGSILKGIPQGKRYSDIAIEYNCTSNHVKDVAFELWQILSKQLGESVNKSNVITSLERNSNFTPSQKANQTGNLTLYWDHAPKLISFYGRHQELTSLKAWLCEENYQLVCITGLIGIGKSYLSARFIEEVKAEFDFIIWLSLYRFANLQELLHELLTILPTGERIPKAIHKLTDNLIEVLRSHRVLIVIDDGQVLFKEKELAGTYQEQYREFEDFFWHITNSQHRSCFLFNTREYPKEMGRLPRAKNLILRGLGEASREIFVQDGLKETDKWDGLIKLYDGHPL